LRPFKINVFKRDLKPHYSWETQLIYHDAKSGFWCTASPAPRWLDHHTKGRRFEFQTQAMEWFWSGLPFSLGWAHDPESKTISCYCNIHEPLKAVANELSFVDLDLDIVINDAFPRPTIIDQTEFLDNFKKYNYPQNYRELVPRSAEQVVELLHTEPLFQTTKLQNIFNAIFTSEGITISSCPEILVVSEYFRQHPWPRELYIFDST
jgi:protein associated with RNAse G/E